MSARKCVLTVTRVKITNASRTSGKVDGLVVGSSGFLVNSKLGKIDFTNLLGILEFGSSKGAFIRELIHRMSAVSMLHVADIKTKYNPWMPKMIAENPAKNITRYSSCVTELLRDANY